jgi:hypothetical protein
MRPPAVVVNSVAAEYDHITKKIGVRGIDWVPVMQCLQEDGDKHFDKITVELNDGTSRSFRFDITSFFGK